MTGPAAAEPAWVAGVHGALRRYGVGQVSYVPDGGLAALIRRCRADADLTVVGLSTEEEGVALAAGAWLGGTRSAVLMQSSGVGNCVNMLSLWQSLGVPAVLLVTMRGQFGEANPWQVPMGRITPEVLRLCGLTVLEVDDAARITDTVEAAAAMAFTGGTACAVTIGQRAIGAKAFVAAAPASSAIAVEPGPAGRHDAAGDGPR